MYAQIKVNLYEGKPPGNLTELNPEVYLSSGRGRLDSVTIPAITIFKPAVQDARKPAIVICPGGGYSTLSIFDGGYDIAKELNKSGIVAIVLKYRTFIPGYYINYTVAPFDDLEKAFQIMKDSAVQWNIDLSNVGVMGLSAGGHLASMKAVNEKGFKTAFNILIYPVISFMDYLTSPTTKSRKTLLGKNPSQNLKETYSSELMVSANTKPCFIVQAQDDSTVLVQNSLAFYTELVKQKVKAEMILYQHGGHGFAGYNKAEDDYWIPKMVKWMKLNQFLTK